MHNFQTQQTFHHYLAKRNYKRTVLQILDAVPHYIVVIPAFNEPDIQQTLQSLAATSPIGKPIEVIIIANQPQSANASVQRSNQQMLAYIEAFKAQNTSENIYFSVYWFGMLPDKYAGVGMARKIGMDLAVERFAQNHTAHGYILSLDADTLVSPDYFRLVDAFVANQPKCNGFTIGFQHQKATDVALEKYIRWYETHLYYYRAALKFAGFPFAFFTIGSAFGVKAQMYVKIGGMSKRKAGEDFYFLHKLAPHGHFHELKETLVFPAARLSDRVPFGTGPLLQQLHHRAAQSLSTYPPEAFVALKKLIEQVPYFWLTPHLKWEKHLILVGHVVLDFLKQHGFCAAVQQLKQKSSSFAVFERHFFSWLDGFRVVKLMNYFRQYSSLPAISVQQASQKLFADCRFSTDMELLDWYKKQFRTEPL